jgi:hypothetical protein
MFDAIEAMQRLGVAEGTPVAAPAITDFRIWPNVLRTGSSVSFANPQARKARLEIYNAAGRRVSEMTIPAGQSAHRLGGLPAGVYFAALEGTAARIRLTVLK